MWPTPRSSYVGSAQPRQMVEYQRFTENYFSGCDVHIYFGDIVVDEIVSLQFAMSENVTPVFGYASYTYDAVARGTRVIQGSFRINYKENYYIHSITNEIQAELTADNKVSIPSFSDVGNAEERSIESIYAAVNNGDTSVFEKLANEYEKALWGGSTSASMNKLVNDQETTTYFYPSEKQKGLADNGYNIMITYGSMGNEKVQSTARTIIGVQLTGVAQVIEPSGQPLYEEYSFIARDLDGNFGKTGKYK